MATELKWLGHGSWSIQTGEYQIILDPFLDENPASPVKAAEVEADYILVSHGHADHTADAESIAKRCGALLIANFEICAWFEKRGISHTHAMNIGGGYEFPFGRVKMVPAWHSSTMPDGTNGGNPCGFVISFPEGRVYFACDTGVFYDMTLIGSVGIDLAVLPIGDNFTMGPDDALEAVRLLKPRRVVPVHHDTWPVIAQNADQWADRVHDKTGVEPVVLEPGETIVLEKAES